MAARLPDSLAGSVELDGARRSPLPTIAVVGLGNIGFRIAERLVLRGRRVVGIDVDERRRDAWRAATQLEPAGGLDELDWEHIGIVFVVVRLAGDACHVLRQLSIRTERGRVAYVITTLDVGVARDLDSFNSGSFRVVELPVSGGEAGAAAGTLTVMAAGPLAAEDERFLLDTVATTCVRFDDYGEPTLAKLLNNVLAAYNAVAFSHVILLGEQAGLDPEQVREVIMTSSGASWILGPFADFPADLLTKDVELLRNDLGALPSVDLDTVGANSLETVIGKARRALGIRSPISER